MKPHPPPVVLLLLLAIAAGCSKSPRPGEVAATLADASASASLAAIIASCASASGTVEVRRPGKPYWEAVATGAVFRAGDWVRTAKDAAARVEFLAGGGLELGPESVVVVDARALAPDSPDAGAPEAVVSVESGEVRGFAAEVTEEGEAPALHIKTADGSEVSLVAKEGEEPMRFRLTRVAQATEVAVTRGAAVLHGSAGELDLRAGQATDVAAGGRVSAAFELLDFPQLKEPGIDARFAARPGVVIRLGWRPVPGAASYRLEVAKDLSFQVQAVVADLEETSYEFRPEGEAVYVWRVASQDAGGRQGEFGFARRIYFEREQPRELLLGPADGATFSALDGKPRVTFSWQSAADARAYRLVVASTEDLLRSAVLSLEASDQRIEVKTLAPGEYWWGAYIEGDLPTPIFLKARRLTVKRGTRGKLKTPKAINQWGD